MHPTLQTPYQVLRCPSKPALGLLGVPSIVDTAVSASSIPLEIAHQSWTVWNIWHQNYPWNELELQHHSPATALQRQYDWSPLFFSQRDACHPLKFPFRHGGMMYYSSQLLFNVIYVGIAPERVNNCLQSPDIIEEAKVSCIIRMYIAKKCSRLKSSSWRDRWYWKPMRPH